MRLLIPRCSLTEKNLYGALASSLPVNTYHHIKIKRSVSVNFRDTEGAQNVMQGLLIHNVP